MTPGIRSAHTEARHLARSGLTPRHCLLVKDRVEQCLAILEKHSGTGLKPPLIRFDLAGMSAGQYLRRKAAGRRTQHCLRFNPYLLATHLAESLESTVPHEVAHYAVAILHKGHRVRPHGAEWKGLMYALGALPERTHAFNVKEIPSRRQRRWSYHCSCSSHELTTTRHNRVLGGTRYYCRICSGLLEPYPRSALKKDSEPR